MMSIFIGLLLAFTFIVVIEWYVEFMDGYKERKRKKELRKRFDVAIHETRNDINNLNIRQPGIVKELREHLIYLETNRRHEEG